jgi:hypothetical protein
VLYLHFKTFPSFLAFKIAEKSLSHGKVKHKKKFREKRKINFDFSHFSALGVEGWTISPKEGKLFHF